MTEFYQVQKERTRAHWLSLLSENGEESYAKWDGCCETMISGERIHICDPSEAIKQLQELQEKAKKHFGESWPE